ncbi:uncharacterized protein EDB93DRAFT_1334537, partial [Suillus bovinus]|uniref:uncharacterized protein n=1 Tax=Suillus bovinus TaxID=48563 RepID=UPI001B878282
MTRQKGNSSRDSTQETSSQAAAPGSSHRPRSKIGRFLKKLKEDTKKFRTRSKGSRSQVSPAPPSDERPSTPTTDVQAAPSDAEVEADSTKSALRNARKKEKGIHPLPKPAETAVSVAGDAESDLDDVDSFDDTYLEPLKIFDSIIDKIADLHPYAKIALGVLSWTAKIILAQTDRDREIYKLLKKLCRVYRFITQDGKLNQKLSMRATRILGKISKQIRECANFIGNYSETSDFWKRLGKNVGSETTNTIQQYNDVLDRLMSDFQDQVLHDVATQVGDIDIQVHHIAQILELSGMTYAKGAGLDTRK